VERRQAGVVGRRLVQCIRTRCDEPRGPRPESVGRWLSDGVRWRIDLGETAQAGHLNGG